MKRCAHRSTIFLVVAGPGLVSLLVLVGWVASALSQDVVDVPGPNLPTIQSGIDSLPNGGTVRIAVKTYKEHVVIDGKPVVLEGAGPANSKRPTIKADDPENAVITFVNGGGGAVRNLILQGGAFGIAAGAEESEQCIESSSALEVEGVEILKSGRGIYGSFGSLTVLATEISKTGASGISLVGCGDLLISGASIHDSGGAGVVLFNYDAPPGASMRRIENSEFRKNKGGGIDVRGGVLPVTIDTCTMSNNKIFGISLFSSHNTIITNSALSFSQSIPGTPKPIWGDGLRVFRSNPVAITGCTLAFNERAGLSAYGCDGGLESVVTVTDNTFNNPIDLTNGKLRICATGQSSPIFPSPVGNTCFSGPCISQPSDLSPIPPPATK